MSSASICALRSVALHVPDLGVAESFYTTTWRLDVAARTEDALLLRGSGSDHHVLALYRGGTGAPTIRHITLRARSIDALSAIVDATRQAGGQVLAEPGPANNPAGGTRIRVADADGRVFEVVHGDTLRSDGARPADQPLRLAHVVLNCHDVGAAQRFLERAFGFTLADRTKVMAFMNCDRDHHSIALHDADNDALNHIAFLMPELDAVMRGGGRMKDAGHQIEWGPGRHGPGNNAFNYFIDPFGVAIEYTAEVEQIDDRYVVGGPDHWKWPAGRVDQWGISPPPSARLREAQRQVFFAPPNRP